MTGILIRKASRDRHAYGQKTRRAEDKMKAGLDSAVAARKCPGITKARGGRKAPPWSLLKEPTLPHLDGRLLASRLREKTVVFRLLVCGCYSSPRKLTHLVPQSPRTSERVSHLPPGEGGQPPAAEHAPQPRARVTPSQSDPISHWARVTGDTQQADVQTWRPFFSFEREVG